MKGGLEERREGTDGRKGKGVKEGEREGREKESRISKI